MYKCSECGEIFDEPKKYSEDRTPGGSFEGGSFIEHFLGCPICSGTFDEVEECSICGEYKFPEDLTDTTGMINGDCGYCCEQCLEDNDIKEL